MLIEHCVKLPGLLKKCILPKGLKDPWLKILISVSYIVNNRKKILKKKYTA
jgi:hypothetical protein